MAKVVKRSLSKKSNPTGGKFSHDPKQRDDEFLTTEKVVPIERKHLSGNSVPEDFERPRNKEHDVQAKANDPNNAKSRNPDIHQDPIDEYHPAQTSNKKAS